MSKGVFIREIIISIPEFMVFLVALTLAPIQEVAAGELNSPHIVSYVWNDDKEPLYASPSHDSEPLAFLEAGERVERLAVAGPANSHVIIYQRAMEEFFAEDYLSIWTEPATWLKVRWKGREGYMLDTYLLHFPPPQHDPQQAFIIEYYLKDLSPTTSDLFIGNTEEFCEQRTISYENGMTCILTDYGPCEQCGHMQYILSIPKLHQREAIVMGMVFFRRYGLFEENAYVLMKQEEDGVVIEGYSEFGHYYNLRIEGKPDGVTLTEDVYV